MKINEKNPVLPTMDKGNFKSKLRYIRSNYEIYIMILPVIIFYAIFNYAPMYGVLMAFQNYKPILGMSGSEWVGFDNFASFINSVNFARVFKNTLVISVGTLLFSFPTPILLALSINEVRNKIFKKTVQTITYLPHFISIVIVCSLVHEFTSSSGIINQFVQLFGYSGKNYALTT